MNSTSDLRTNLPLRPLLGLIVATFCTSSATCAGPAAGTAKADAAATSAEVKPVLESEAGDSLHYELVLGEQHALCRDVSTLMNSGALPATHGNYCTWRFRPNLKHASKMFSLPKWELVDESKYLDFSRQAYAVPGAYEAVDSEVTEKSWQKNAFRYYQELIHDKHIRYYTSWLDLDGNGDKEHVLLQDINDCDDPSRRIPPGPVPFVLKDGNEEKLDPRYGPIGIQIANPFFYDGRIRFSRWNLPPVGVFVRKDGRKPEGTVEIFESSDPGQNNPFLYKDRYPVCQFHVFK